TVDAASHCCAMCGLLLSQHFRSAAAATLSQFLCYLLRRPPTTAIYTLSLHDALPISSVTCACSVGRWATDKGLGALVGAVRSGADRKSTRLNSSHEWISYAVFCLKKKIDI